MAGNSARPNAALTLLKLVGVLVAAGVLAAGLALPYVGGFGLAARHEGAEFLDTTCHLPESPAPRPTTLYARDGKTVLAKLFKQDRQDVPLSQVPVYLQKALIATEDRRFYEHHGVDMRGLLRSALSTSSGDTQGGSTLTMQLVKQIRYYHALVDENDKAAAQAAIAVDLQRKMEDAQCALYLENVKHWSKDTILDKYLNIAFFGENAYGIQRAAETYFGKPASKLTLPESATLVGLLQAPDGYDPFKHPDRAKDRRNQVLRNLVDVGELSPAQADQYERTPISLATKKPPVVHQGCASAATTVDNVGFFCDYATAWLENVQGIKDLSTGGYKIVTTLDPRVQNDAQKGVSKAIPATSPMTAVLPAVDPKSGDVLAMAASKLYGPTTSDKDKTHTMLSIFTKETGFGASTYKLFPLLTALGTGIPSDWELQTYDDGKKYYSPHNCTPRNPPVKVINGDANVKYHRNESLASATAKSSNTYFVRLADQGFACDLKPIVDIATKLGMKGLSEKVSGNPKLTVGQQIVQSQSATLLVLGNVPTSALEVAGAYAAVANDGKYNPPAPILSITDSHGKQIQVKRSPGTQVVSPQVARQAVEILQGDTSGEGTSADAFDKWYDKNSSIVAGKTGTSTAVDPHTLKETDKNASLWFAGMTPDLVGVSALVNFDHPSWPATGLPGVKHPATEAYGAYAAGVWLDAFGPALVKKDWSWAPPGAVPGVDVPDIVGMSLSEAKSTLAKAGFKMAQLDPTNHVSCPSLQDPEQIAFYAPQRAPKGSTITICQSSGATPKVYHKPTPPPPPPAPPATTHNSTPAGGHHTTSPSDHGGENGPRGGRSGRPGNGSGRPSHPGDH